MKKTGIILIIIILTASIAFGILALKYFFKKPMKNLLQKQATESIPQKTGEEKKAAIIIAFENFRDEEYFKTSEVLAKGEIEIKVISTQKGTAIGTDGGEVEINLTLDELKVDDFDAVLFIGGPGALEYLDNEKSYKIAKEALEKNKLLAAICISPTILAKAGVLEGKKATVWASPLDRQPIEILEKNGAEFIDEKVVQDGNIITGNGPAASQEFGQKVLENLRK